MPKRRPPTPRPNQLYPVIIAVVRYVCYNTHKINGCLGQNLMGEHLGKSAFYSPTKDYRVYSFLK